MHRVVAYILFVAAIFVAEHVRIVRCLFYNWLWTDGIANICCDRL